MTEPTGDVLIRDLTDDDLARVHEINQANVPEVGSVDAERLAFIVAESELALVVELDGAVVGFCLVLGPGSTYDSVNYRWFMDRYDDVWYLDRVAFDESAQGRGLGTALYVEVARRMAGSGLPLALEVNVDPPNEASLAFHAKHQFVEVGRQTAKGIEVSLMLRPAID